MKTDTPSLETPQAARLRRRQLIRQLLERDKTPLAILFMAAVVGTLVGLAAVAFDKGVAWLQNQRMGALVHTADNYPLLLTVAFLCSAVLAMFGYFLVRKYAPEAGGSGIPEIEGALEDQRPVRWWRVLPVKFFGGLGTLGGGMVLGREGPTVQIGGNIGRMVLDVFRLKGDEARHTLLATGAAAGLAAAFNAPLAGILFIIEEMRPQFRYTLISIKAVFIGVIMSTIMYRIFNHEVALIDVGKLSDAPLNTLWLYLILGIIFGIFGPIFNKWVLGMQDLLHRVHGGNITKWVLMGGAIGGLCGLLGFVAPATSGGGFNLIPIATAGNFSMGMLVFIFVARVITTLLCFVRDNDIAHFQRWCQATGRTGVNNHIWLAVFQQQSGTQRRSDFTDARFQKRNLGSIQLAGIDFATAQTDSLTVFDFVTQQRNFFFHCTNDADFHRFTRFQPRQRSRQFVGLPVATQTVE